MTDKYDGWGDRVGGFTDTIEEICEHYGEALGYSAIEVFKALEKWRDYSYPNYYQWANFPRLDEVIVFKNSDEMLDKVKPHLGFRCPNCEGKTKSPYVCDSGKKVDDDKTCDWKVYGLFGTLGKGARITISENWIEKPIVQSIFYPLAWENEKIQSEFGVE